MYWGQDVQIDAKEVFQPINPGDGRIGRYDYIGPAPRSRSWLSLEGLRLSSALSVSDDGKPVASIIVTNQGSSEIRILAQELSLTLLMKRANAGQTAFSASDGPSFALITRQSFEVGGTEPRWKGEGITSGTRYAWNIGEGNALPHSLILAPGQARKVDIKLDLPDGEYDFLCGYAGGVHEGRCLASNLTAFDIKNGRTKVVTVNRRP